MAWTSTEMMMPTVTPALIFFFRVGRSSVSGS
jgi:hypothetical protein